jgi:CubicO group peptidase (beta-lactamase class C family)/tetratricopeptide (TPR) repeat protein
VKPAFAQTSSTQVKSLSQIQLKEFEDFVDAQMKRDKVPGLSIGFIKGDEVWAKGYGFADLENKLPARAESMYRLASVTKPMTAAAVLQLAEKGKINLDAEVQTYVSYFPKKNFPVTVRQLLGHLGGISHYKNYDAEGHFKDAKTTRQAIAVFESFDLVAEPGTRFNYSSYGYNLLGAIIEGASGQTYAEYMRENVWKPLGMSDIRMDNPREIIPNRVRGYENNAGQISNSEFVDISSRFAAGGTRATVLDLLKFGKGINDGKILSRASLDLMFNSMVTKSGALTGYSAGWSASPTNGRFEISHSGGQQETSTYLFNFPSRNLVIAVMSNLEGANTSIYVQKLFEMLTGEAWNTNAYISERPKFPLYVALIGTFEEGRAAFEKTRKPLTGDAAQLAEAFNYVNQNLTGETLQEAKMQDVLAKARAGRQVSAGQPFAKIGAYMADRLQQKYGAERLSEYSNAGAITFFSDYIALYKQDNSIPKEFRFNETVEQTVAAWQAGWSKTNTPEARKLVISSNSNFDEIGARLRREFAGATVFPNYADALNSAVRYLIVNNQKPKALQAAQLSAELYPALDSSNAFYGIALVLSGDKEKGKQFLKRSTDLNPNGQASAGGLNSAAYNIASSSGLLDEALTLLLVATELYPQEANLYDSLGEFYSRKGMKDKAIEYYQKALAVNPKYGNAEKAKEILQKLATNP